MSLSLFKYDTKLQVWLNERQTVILRRNFLPFFEILGTRERLRADASICRNTESRKMSL